MSSLKLGHESVIFISKRVPQPTEVKVFNASLLIQFKLTEDEVITSAE